MKQSISEVIINGSPQKWFKKKFVKYLIGNFFAGLGLAISFYGTFFGFFMIYRKLGYIKRKQKGEGRLPNKYSASFGINGAQNVKINTAFKIIYIFAVLIFSGGLGAFIFLFFDILGRILLSYMLIFFTYSQIKGLTLFKYKIMNYACPSCGIVNTMMKGRTSNYESHEEEKVVGTKGGGQYKSGTVYANGKEVGDVYSTAPSYNVYQKYRKSSWQQWYVCSRCGYELSKTEYESYKIGDKHY